MLFGNGLGFGLGAVVSHPRTLLHGPEVFLGLFRRIAKSQTLLLMVAIRSANRFNSRSELRP